jgi:integrase
MGSSGRGYDGWHRAKVRLDERIARTAGPLAHWTVHDLRRSFCSHANELGVEPHIIEQCMGHKIQGVAARYNHAVYLNQRRAAIQRWSDTLMAWVAGKPGSNIVTLQRPA